MRFLVLIKLKTNCFFVFHAIVGLLVLPLIKIKHGKGFREEIKALLLLSLGPLSGLLMLPSPVRKMAVLESQKKDP